MPVALVRAAAVSCSLLLLLLHDDRVHAGELFTHTEKKSTLVVSMCNSYSQSCLHTRALAPYLLLVM